MSEHALNEWNSLFPGVCPGCGNHHRKMNPYIKKGFCVACKHRMSESEKKRWELFEIVD